MDVVKRVVETEGEVATPPALEVGVTRPVPEEMGTMLVLDEVGRTTFPDDVG